MRKIKSARYMVNLIVWLYYFDLKVRFQISWPVQDIQNFCPCWRKYKHIKQTNLTFEIETWNANRWSAYIYQMVPSFFESYFACNIV